ncbi:DNA-processing protein DprA [Schaalia sp. ZJ1691]|uniref:DNA-processing protein DprA n=1 Tax=Schaalia sp. ZJ1691 TaxID=2709404 RepID=UPI001F156B53|nr:DNA-processing protein DprA [Schaalia sp. ZJ1691]
MVNACAREVEVTRVKTWKGGNKLWIAHKEDVRPDDYMTNTVAITGTRATTRYGEAATRSIVSGLSGSDVTIITGGSLGVEAAALEAAIDHGLRTVVVLPHGLDNLYPRLNIPLFNEVVRHGGIVISQVPYGAKPERANCLNRTKLIAHLSDVVVVVESVPRSASSAMFQEAQELGIPCGAVPCGIFDGNFGTLDLIRQGATLIRDGEDVLKMME